MSGTDHASKAPTADNQPMQAATMTTQEPESMEKTLPKHEGTNNSFDDRTPPPESLQSRRTTTPNQIPSTPSRKHKPRRSSQAASSPRTTPSRSSSRHNQSSSPRKPNPRQSSRATSSTRTTPSRSSSLHPTITPSSSRPTSSHCTLSRRSSLSASARHHPSRHSSFPTAAHRPLPHRDALTSYIHLYENPFLPHPKTQNRASVVHSFTTFETYPDQLRSASLPIFPPSTTDEDDEIEGTHSRSYSNFVPATTMDWKLPATRRREYEAMERDRSGVRGLWRRLAPRWWRSRRDREVGFWDGGKGDGGSVRRYRIDVEGEGELGGRRGKLMSLLAK